MLVVTVLAIPFLFLLRFENFSNLLTGMEIFYLVLFLDVSIIL